VCSVGLGSVVEDLTFIAYDFTYESGKLTDAYGLADPNVDYSTARIVLERLYERVGWVVIPNPGE
jgi:hypothetical protein